MGKKDRLKSTQQQRSLQKTTTTTTKIKQTKGRNKKINKITQLLTAAPELVTLDCSFTHVLQAPNTQPYHS